MKTKMSLYRFLGVVIITCLTSVTKDSDTGNDINACADADSEVLSC